MFEFIRPFLGVDAEIAEYVVRVYGSYNEPIHGIVVRLLIAIRFRSLDGILAPTVPALSVKRHACRFLQKKKRKLEFVKNIDVNS